MTRPSAKKSIVWTFFDITADKKNVTCKLSKKVYTHHGNTSNIKEHLKRLHPIQLQAEEVQRAGIRPNTQPSSSGQGSSREANSISTTSSSSIQSSRTGQSNIISNTPPSSSGQGSSREANSTSTTSSSEIQASSGTGQSNTAKITSVGVKRKRQLLLTSEHAELTYQETQMIDDGVVAMIVEDYQPLSLVEDTGFKKLVRALNSKYELPSRKTLTEKLLPAHYQAVKEKLYGALQESENVSLTSDYWKSSNEKTFLSLTAHFVSLNKLNQAVLATKEIMESHTAINTAAAIADICNEWDIYSKVLTVVTDNAANMKKAVSEELHKHHHPCVAHTLNLTVMDAITANDEFTALLAKCRGIVTHFRQSSISSYKLKEIQEQHQFPVLKLIQYVMTRWNSAYLMLERLLKVKQPLTLTLTDLNGPNNLSGEEWAALSDCLPVLKTFVEMTEILSGEKYLTMSMVVPLIRGLQFSLANIMPETNIGRGLRSSLMDLIIRRLGNLETNKIVAKATFLDPRFKKTGFGTDENGAKAQQWVTEELAALMNRDIVHIRTTENRTDRETENNSASSLWTHFDQKASESNNHETPSTTAIVMVKQYVEVGLINRGQDPLHYWRDHANTFPGLYTLAKKYLSVPATSVPSERLFSRAGYVLSDRRNRLGSEKLNEILFLNGNLSLI